MKGEKCGICDAYLSISREAHLTFHLSVFTFHFFFLIFALAIGSHGAFALRRLKGNRVKIPNSSRCCESQRALRHLKSLDKATPSQTLGRLRRARQVRRPANRFITRLCLRRMGWSATCSFSKCDICGIVALSGIEP